MAWLTFWRKPVAPQPAPAPKRRTRVDPNLAGMITPKDAKPPRNPFEPAKPMPGVVPTAQMAMDSDVLAVTNWGQGFGNWQGMYFLGYTELAQLSQRAEYRLISETFAKEMTRKFIKLTAVGDESKNPKIKQLNAALSKLKVRDAFRRAAELDGFFGRAHIYIDTGATDNPDELKTPLLLKPEKIGIGSLHAIKVVEPMWTYPASYNSTDPLRDDFYNPQSWYVMGKEISATRLLTFVGREMPDMLKPAYMFGGLSRTQMAQECVNFWIRDRDAVSDLVTNFSTPVLSTDMSAALQAPMAGAVYSDSGATSDPIARVEVFNKFRDNRGTFLLNKDTEEFGNVSVPLGTLDKLQAQSQEHIAAVAKLPLIKMTGITPSGLNASSDSEIRSFYDDVNAEQEDFFTDNFVRILSIIQLSEFGEIDPGITHEYVSLWTLDEAGNVAVQKIKADIAAVLIQEGVISSEEDRERVATDPESQYAGLDLSSPPPAPPEDNEHPDLADASSKIGTQGAEGSESEANSGV